ncbi:MAG: Ribosomal large subunit pseudouridine synthase [Labilithrix sp.]|nr:Ribosomal large subunit pseudouridine synthase [Labilithrix sp.]
MKARPTAREKRWVVREGDGATVGDIVLRARESMSAVPEGRVFVGRRRVTAAAEPVKVGDEVRIGAALPAANAAPPVPILWERDGLLACDKPAGLPTVPDHAGASHSLLHVVAAQTGRAPDQLRVTSRLDREVSGVVVFATSPASEARLLGARERGLYTRRYVAIATAAPALPSPWTSPIGLGNDPRHRAAFGPDGKASATRYAVVARAGDLALLAVEPQTGRTHQIRVHASHAGAPLLGDRDYGGASRLTLASGAVVALARIALHAARVVVPGADDAPLVATAPVPAELTRAWRELGGAAEAWDTAVACSVSP